MHHAPDLLVIAAHLAALQFDESLRSISHARVDRAFRRSMKLRGAGLRSQRCNVVCVDAGTGHDDDALGRLIEQRANQLGSGRSG